MAQVIWTDNALHGLRDVVEYVELFNPLAASNLAKEVFLATDRLIDFPESCPLVQELPDHSFRQILVDLLRLLYLFDNDTVTIMHVIRQERSLRAFLA